MITLKHIMREFEIDNGNNLRTKLRKAGIEHKRNQRWQWQPDDPELAKVREIAQSMETKA